MKHLIVTLLVSLAFTAVAQQEDYTSDWETNVKKAADLSIQEKKPLFLFFTGSDWCGVCMKLQREVFSQPQFQEWVKKNTIPVEVDFPRNHPADSLLQVQNDILKETFGITGFPTVVFVTPNKNQLGLVYTRIGSIGYQQGGADAWIESASRYLPKKN